MKANKQAQKSKHICPTRYQLPKDTLVAIYKLKGSGTKKQIAAKLAEMLKLSKAALSEKHKGKERQSEFEWQLDWVYTELKKIGAITQEGRGDAAVYRLTDKGREYAKDKNVTVKTLNRLHNEVSNSAANKSTVGNVSATIPVGGLQVDAEYLASALVRCGQIVLTGAPGTGKTRLAKEIAKKVTLNDQDGDKIGFCQFHPSYDYTDFVEGLRPQRNGTSSEVSFARKDGVFKDFCKRAVDGPRAQFDAKFAEFAADAAKSYSPTKPLTLKTPVDGKNFRVYINGAGNVTVSTGGKKSPNFSVTRESLYMDWIGESDGRNSSYTRGVLAYLNVKYKLPKKVSSNYVFIIDEINRGDISKIFGELFYAIDMGYRGQDGRVETQYQNLIDDDDVFKGGFYVPKNVFIIGTMNDVDRGVENIDFAIRRRFTWYEITPEMRADDIFRELDKSERREARERMNRLNDAIKSGATGLGNAYCIGPAYFLALNELGNDFDKLWDFHLAPLLREYLRGFPEPESRMDVLRAAYYGD